MNAAAKIELENIKSELQSIINELNDIALGVKNDFDGIGNERCAAGIVKVADEYQRVKRILNRIH